MAFKLYWEHALDKTKTGIGPIIGSVQKYIFIPDTKKVALARVENLKTFAKRGNYDLLEVPFTPEDLPELRKIHPIFFSQVDCTHEE